MATPMVDMEMDDELAGEMALPIEMPRHTFPYGLRLCLTGPELNKLKLDPKAMIKDGILHVHAMARITDVSHSDGQSGENHRVELQIESMKVEGEDEENDKADKSMKGASALYDRS